jgi:branched-chain amino acid transport system permease protein
MSIGDILSFNFLAHHLVFIGIFLILALSLNLINGYAGMFSLGHQGFWAVGAYAAGALIVHMPGSLPGPLLFMLSIGAAMLCATLAGLVIGVPCLRLRGDYLAIATLGFAEIIRIVLTNLEWVGASRGLHIPYQVIVRSPDTQTDFYVFWIVFTYAMVLVTFVMCRNLIHSSHGRAIVSLREDEVASQLLGVNITRYKVLTFLLGSAFAGLAGAIHANFFGFISPKDFQIMQGILILLMVVLGGLGSMTGTVLATFILYSVQQILKLRLLGLPTSLASASGSDALMGLARALETLAVDRWQLIFAVMLMILMIAAPQGLFGKKELWDTAIYRRLFAGRWRRGAIQADLGSHK